MKFKQFFTEAKGGMPEANVMMNNKNGKKFMELLYTLLDSGAKIESYALGRWGMLSIPGDREGINVHKLSPSGKVSKKASGWTSFKSGDKVELIKVNNDFYKVQNILNENTDDIKISEDSNKDIEKIRNAKIKIKNIHPTRFGTEVEFFKEKDAEEAADLVQADLDNKSIFIK